MADLHVWIRDHAVGVLSHDPGANRFRFEYTDAWRGSTGGFALSPQLPLRPAARESPEQHSAQVRQFFENLLPEGEALDHAAGAAGTARSNLMGLLAHLGRETAGALRVTTEADASPGSSESVLREITAAQLSQRIRDRAELPFSVWDGKVRLSIAGYQDKIAVLARDGKTFLVDGGKLASTFIVKPAPARAALANLPAIEHMAMQLARRVGLPTADTRLVHVPEPVLLVRRFDRVDAGDEVRRLHVIDGCQALGLAAGMKYERAYGDGADVAHLRDGASLPKLFALLDQSAVPALDRVALLRWTIFQVLIGNTDAHGKNVSFFFDEKGLRLAPAYDLVSMPVLGDAFDHAYAMAIGDAFTAQDLSPYEWAHFAFLCDLPFRLVGHELEAMAGRVSGALDGFAREMTREGVPRPVARRFVEVVQPTCVRQRVLAAKVGRFRRTDYTGSASHVNLSSETSA